MTQQQLRHIASYYREGHMSEEEVKRYEEANKMPMEALVQMIEAAFEMKDFSVASMRITDLKRLLKYPDTTTEQDKEKYEKYNKCSYEQVLEMAKKRVNAFDGDRENRKMRGAIQQLSRDNTRINKTITAMDAMEERGMGTFDRELGYFKSNSGVETFMYLGSSASIWDRIIDKIKESPRDIHTMAIDGTEEKYFHVTLKAGNLCVSQSGRNPYVEISEPVYLYEKDCKDMVFLYGEVKKGCRFAESLKPEIAFWMGILKYMRM